MRLAEHFINFFATLLLIQENKCTNVRFYLSHDEIIFFYVKINVKILLLHGW